MSTSHSNSMEPTEHSNFIHYLTGFIFSCILTIAAYLSVTYHIFPTREILLITLVGLALTQLFVQLIFFLHLGSESKPYWNVILFCFTTLVVGIVVLGSLWIMKNLNYNMMSPNQITNYVSHDEGITK